MFSFSFSTFKVLPTKGTRVWEKKDDLIPKAAFVPLSYFLNKIKWVGMCPANEWKKTYL